MSFFVDMLKKKTIYILDNLWIFKFCFLFFVCFYGGSNVLCNLCLICDGFSCDYCEESVQYDKGKI